jgi:hypothetical protein
MPKPKFHSRFQSVCDSSEPGQFFMVGILHYPSNPTSDLASTVHLTRRTPGRLDWDPIIQGADLFTYPSWFTCLVRDNANTLYVGEDDGFVRHKAGVTTVTKLRDKVKGLLTCAYVRGVDNVVFGTSDGEIIHYQDDQVSVKSIGSMFSKVTGRLNGMHGVGADFIVTVGPSGDVGQFTNGKWARVKSPTSVSLEGVWCCSTSEVYVVGLNASAWRWNGQDQWQALSFELKPDTNDFNVYSVTEFQGNVYAACGQHGVYQLKDERFVLVTPEKTGYVGQLAVTNVGLIGTGNAWGNDRGSWITLFEGKEWRSAQMQLVER